MCPYLPETYVPFRGAGESVVEEGILGSVFRLPEIPSSEGIFVHVERISWGVVSQRPINGRFSERGFSARGFSPSIIPTLKP